MFWMASWMMFPGNKGPLEIPTISKLRRTADVCGVGAARGTGSLHHYRDIPTGSRRGAGDGAQHSAYAAATDARRARQ
jgi:hypothetical protein